MAVEGWVGWHGQGKTYCALEYGIKTTLRRGMVLCTNAGVTGSISVDEFAVLCQRNGEFPDDPGVAWRPGQYVCVRFTGWDDLMDFIELAVALKLSVLILVDEGGKFLNARYWNKLDPRVQTIFQERRKIGGGVDLHFTVPSFKHVDSQLRDVTQYVHLVKRLGGSEYSHDGKHGKPRLFYVKTYRPTSLSDGVGNGIKRGSRAVTRKLVPFSAAMANLYGTEVLEMDKPFADKVLARPDMGPLRDAGPPVLLPAPQGRKRGR